MGLRVMGKNRAGWNQESSKSQVLLDFVNKKVAPL